MPCPARGCRLPRPPDGAPPRPRAADVAKYVRERGNHQLPAARDGSFQRSMWPTPPSAARQLRGRGTRAPHVPWQGNPGRGCARAARALDRIVRALMWGPHGSGKVCVCAHPCDRADVHARGRQQQMQSRSQPRTRAACARGALAGLARHAGAGATLARVNFLAPDPPRAVSFQNRPGTDSR